MKKIITLTLFAGLALTVDARQFKFKDGTTLNADIRRDGVWAPNSTGVVLTVGGRLYIHHFPTTPNAAAAPNMEGDSVPSRIGYQHFTVETLRELYRAFSPSRKTVASAAQMRVMAAIIAPANSKRPASFQQTQLWQRSVENRIGHLFNSGIAVWGRYVAMPQVPANTTMLNVRLSNQQPFAQRSIPVIHPITGLPIAQPQSYTQPMQTPVQQPYVSPMPAMGTQTFQLNPSIFSGMGTPMSTPAMPMPMFPHDYDNCLPNRLSLMNAQQMQSGYYNINRR